MIPVIAIANKCQRARQKHEDDRTVTVQVLRTGALILLFEKTNWNISACKNDSNIKNFLVSVTFCFAY